MSAEANYIDTFLKIILRIFRANFSKNYIIDFPFVIRVCQFFFAQLCSFIHDREKRLASNEIQIMVKTKVDFCLIIIALFAAKGRHYHFLLSTQCAGIKYEKSAICRKCKYLSQMQKSMFFDGFFNRQP